MTRQEGDAVPYGKDEYCAIMKGMLSIDLDQVGTFSSIARSGFTNINEKMKTEYLDNGAYKFNDPFTKDKNGKPLELVRLPVETRLSRVKDTILALKTLSGGAKQSTNMADVTPKLVVLATLKSGNHPFSHLAKEELRKAVFSIGALKEILSDYQDQFEGKVYIGKRTGFMDELDEELKTFSEENEIIEYGTIGKVIDDYVNSITLD